MAAAMFRAQYAWRHVRDRGFEWDASNRPQIARRMRPDGAPLPPHRRLGWIFARGFDAFHAETGPAVDEQGRAVSDHDMVTADLSSPSARSDQYAADPIGDLLDEENEKEDRDDDGGRGIVVEQIEGDLEFDADAARADEP